VSSANHTHNHGLSKVLNDLDFLPVLSVMVTGSISMHVIKNHTPLNLRNLFV